MQQYVVRRDQDDILRAELRDILTRLCIPRTGKYQKEMAQPQAQYWIQCFSNDQLLRSTQKLKLH